METLNGVVERITYINEENGYSVLKLKSKGFSELVTIVGNLAGVNIGTPLALSGAWKNDSRYGRQFMVESYRELVPATIAGLEKYLGSGLIKGIGPVYARKIVRHFREDTLRIIEESADYLLRVEGIGQKRVEMIKTAWQEQKEIKNVMLFLQSNGVSTAYAVKIYKTYGNESIKMVRENPYRLAEDIWGIGFKTADKIAAMLGISPSSPERCRAGLVFTLNEFAKEGHCFAYWPELLAKASELLEIENSLLEENLKKMVLSETVFREEERVYLPAFFFSEKGVASRIAFINKENSSLSGQEEQFLMELEQESSLSYDPVQREAILKALTAKIMVLTGGPGTGKTTTTLAIISILEKMGKRVLLAAPTGRAAKRLSETSGREARTIHRLLEFKPPQGYQRTADYPLECEALVIDETSMVDLILMYNLLKAVPDNAQILFLGDIDQLPSVGAGNVLRDLISSGAVEVVALTRIFRQAQGSKIITSAHLVNQGKFPDLKSGKNSDFFFISCEEPEKIAETVLELCQKRLPAYYKVDPFLDIQVLSPMQRGVTGTENLNRLLQEALNPGSDSLKSGGQSFRVGDKVMQIKNNYDKNVFNGDIGLVSLLNLEERTLSVLFEEMEVKYEQSELDELRLAYATTIHKSQGSEFPVVIAPFSVQHYLLLQRNLLYTCITRAQKLCVLVGSKKALGIAVSNNKIARRNTFLAERLREYSQEEV